MLKELSSFETLLEKCIQNKTFKKATVNASTSSLTSNATLPITSTTSSIIGHTVTKVGIESTKSTKATKSTKSTKPTNPTATIAASTSTTSTYAVNTFTTAERDPKVDKQIAIAPADTFASATSAAKSEDAFEIEDYETQNSKHGLDNNYLNNDKLFDILSELNIFKCEK